MLDYISSMILNWLIELIASYNYSLRMLKCTLVNDGLRCFVFPRWGQLRHLSSCCITCSHTSNRYWEWCHSAVLTSLLPSATESVSTQATKRALQTVWEPSNPVQVGYFCQKLPQCKLFYRLCVCVCFNTSLLFSVYSFRLWDNIQFVKPRPKVSPAALGHRGCCADLHTAFTYQNVPCG